MKSTKGKSNVTLTVSMSPDMLRDLTEIAEESGLTRSSYACSLIYQGLLQHKSQVKALESLPDALKSALNLYAEKSTHIPLS